MSLGHQPQRLDRGLDEEAHEAQLDAVLRLEGLLVLGAQGLDPGHVDLVEGGQQGRGLLGLHQALGDPAADGTHALRGVSVRAPGAAAAAAGPAAPAALEPALRRHVLLQHPSARPGARHLVGVDAALGHDPLRGGHDPLARRGRRRRGFRLR